MAGARGQQVYFEASEVAGEDGRVWQAQGTANSTTGVVFTLRGEAIKAPGIASLTDFSADPAWPLTGPIMSVGAFTHHGMTDILINYADKIAVVRGNNLTTLVSGRTVPEHPRDAHRFVQSGDVLIILNGLDANLKWDGRKITPLGIHPIPPAPAPVTDPEQNIPDVEMVTTTIAPWLTPQMPFDGQNFWSSRAIAGTGARQRFQYKVTWVNDKGQESEASEASAAAVVPGNIPDPSGGSGPNVFGSGDLFNILVTGLSSTPPSDDIVARNLYRSLDGKLWTFVKRLPGTTTDTWWDFVAVGSESTDTLADAGTNRPPPVSLWACPFRGRVYYGGNKDTPSLLYYSRDQGGREAVSVTSFLDVSTQDGDVLTGYALSQDYVVIFKSRSMYMLTHDKTETPILTPITRGVGAVNDRAVVAFEGKVYFMGEQGLYAFDGTKPVPLSRELSRRVALLPRSGLADAFAWLDAENRRILLSLVAGPGDENNEIWALHVDTGAVSRIEDMSVYATVPYKGHNIVSYSHGVGPTYDLGLWAFRDKIGAASSYEGRFETRWLTLDRPTADKEFFRIEVFYVQHGNYQMAIDWSVDWDERKTYSADGVTLSGPNATLWDNGGLWDNSLGSDGFPARSWDSGRVRSARVDLLAGSGVEARGRAIRIGFQTSRGATPWRLVGFLLHYADLGARPTAMDGE